MHICLKAGVLWGALVLAGPLCADSLYERTDDLRPPGESRYAGVDIDAIELYGHNTKTALTEKSQKQIVEELVVTGTRIPTKVTELTHSVTIVNELEIERQGFTDVTEILRQQAGVEFKQAGGVGQFNYLKMRGLGAENVLVVIDGVKINKPSSGNTGTLLSQLDPQNIESLEILRGPQATLYGANSSAGVIAINTKGGSNPRSSVSLETGSMDWRKASLSMRNNRALGSGTWLYSLTLSDTESANTHEHEFFEDTTVQLRTSFETDALTLGVNLYQLDNAFGYAELDENSRAVASRAEHWAYQTPDPEQYSNTREWVCSVVAEHSLSDSLSQTLRLSRADNRYEIHDPDNGLLGTQIASVDGVVNGAIAGDTLYIYDRRWPGIHPVPLDLNDPANGIDDTHAFYEDRSDQLDYNLIYQKPGYDLLGGIEYIEQQASQWGSYGEADNEDSQVSYYLNGNGYLAGGALVLSMGLRSDDYESWGMETTGNLGFAWHITDSTTVYGNAGTSFRPATMRQLFNPTYGDDGLAPESGKTFELGVRHYALNDRLFVEATTWHTKIDDVIFYDYTIPNPRNSRGFGQYNNGAEAQTGGVELKFAYQITDRLALDGNYTYTDSRNKPVAGDWSRTVQIARNKGNLGFSYNRGDLSLGLNAYYSGPRLRWKGDVEMHDYVRVDLSGRYQLFDRVALSLRVENLLDDNIEEGLGYQEPGVYTVLSVDVSVY